MANGDRRSLLGSLAGEGPEEAPPPRLVAARSARCLAGYGKFSRVDPRPPRHAGCRLALPRHDSRVLKCGTGREPGKVRKKSTRRFVSMSPFCLVHRVQVLFRCDHFRFQYLRPPRQRCTETCVYVDISTITIMSP